MQQPTSLKEKWKKLDKQEYIEGNTHHYRIQEDRFLGRGGFGSVNKAISFNKKDTYTAVALKAFKNSQKWEEEMNRDKQLVIMQNLKRKINDKSIEKPEKYLIDIIEVFKCRRDRKWYLATKLCSEGEITNKYRLFKDDEAYVIKFAQRMSGILKYLHYQIFKGFKEFGKTAVQNKAIGIMHRDVKPGNIVIDQNNEFYLIDFGLAKVCYIDEAKLNMNCGTNLYKAPEVRQRKSYNGKIDIWGFGVTFFQVLNMGQKLFNSKNANYCYEKVAFNKFLIERLIDLKKRVIKRSKLGRYQYWIYILWNCLKFDPYERWNSRQLFEALKNPNQWKKENSIKEIDQNNLQLAEIIDYKVKIHVNFQMYRTCYIQNKVFQLFQEYGLGQIKVKKFTFYAIVKYIVYFLIERNEKLKEKIKHYEIPGKYQFFKRTIQEKKMLELREKLTKKLYKEIQKQSEKSTIENITPLQARKSGAFSESIDRFPEILSLNLKEARKLYYEFIHYKRIEIVEDQKFAIIIAEITQFFGDIENFKQLEIIEPEKEKDHNPDSFCIKYLNRLAQRIEKESNQTKSRNQILEECRISFTYNSDINKQENYSDLNIQPIPKK